MMVSNRIIGRNYSKKSVFRSRYIRLALTLLTLALLASTQSAQAAPSSVFLIETDGAEANPTDGLCSLHEAISNIESGFGFHPDCPSGAGGNHSINLDGRTITVATPQDGASGYSIDSPSILAGNITIEGNGGTIQHAPEGTCTIDNGGISEFRLFTLSSNRSLTINNTTLKGGCLKGANGGAFNVSDGTLTLNNSTLVDNTGVRGGAIYTNGGTVRIGNSALTDNTASDDGGAIFNTSTGSVTIANGTLNGNSASDNGGALMTNGGSSTVDIANSTLYGNTSGRWGGALIIGNSGGDIDLFNVTITENVASSNGGGIYRNQGVYDISNSIISGNTSNDCAGTYSTSSARNSLFGYSGSNRGCTGFSPSINVVIPSGDLSTVLETSGGTAVLADNGGSTQTVALAAGSPAFNAGNDTLLPGEPALGIDVDGDGNTTDDPIEADQRGAGYARIALGTVDAGAYELSCTGYTFPYTLGTVNSNLVDDLRLAVTCANLTAAHDTINLNGQTVTFSDAPAAYDATGHNALPEIVESLTIQNGILERDSNLTSCDGTGDRTEFRLLTITTPLLDPPSTDIIVNDMIFRNGCASDVTTSGDDSIGGTIFFDGNLLHLNNTHFEGNTATRFGGAIYTEADMVVVNSSFVNNNGSNANNNGGVIWVVFGTTTATIVNSTISGNTADHGIYNTTNATTKIINSTISGNSDIGVRRAGGSVIIHNTILSNNGGSNCSGSITSDHSYSDDGSCDFSDDNGLDSADISLGALTQASNGTYYYPLLHSDPVNGGSNTLLPNESTLGIDIDGDGTDDPIDVDQIGNTRIVYATVDAGAVEAVEICPTPLAISDETELAFCITWANSNPDANALGLDADVDLTSDLPTIDTEITLNGGGYYVDGANSVRVFEVTSSGDFAIDNVSIQNGKSSNNGGGIYSNGTLTVTNSSFSGNQSSQSKFGGGIYNEGTLTVTNSTFSVNSAGNGGGIYNGETATVTVTDSTLSGNSASGYGGGIVNYYGTMSVTNSTLSGNSADTGGGGIRSHGTLTVTNSTFSDNSAITNGKGGGIYSLAGTVTVTSSTFYDNSASLSGGAINNGAGTVNLAGNILEDGPGGSAQCSGTMTDNGYNLSSDDSCDFDESGADGSADNAALQLGALSGGDPGQQVHTPGAGSDAIGAIPNGTSISNGSETLACDSSTTDQLGADRPADTVGLGPCTAGAVEVAVEICPAPLAISDETELANCITWANANPGADTLGLDANVTLSTALPNITTEITVNGNGFYVDGANSVRVFEVGPSGDFTINNVTIQNGSATSGGGVYNDPAGMLTVTNSTFSGNSATNGGGGVYNDDSSTLTVTDSAFSGNSAKYGGGITNIAGTLTVTNSTFSGNSATSGSGGGIYSTDDTLTVTNSTFSGNSATNGGGGVYNDDTVTVTYSTFYNNSAGSGGAIYNINKANLAGNIFSGSAQCDGTMTDNGYNLSSDDSCDFDESGASGSADNATLNLGALIGVVHAPADPSDAIGAIPNGTSINNKGVTLACDSSTTDQLGTTRPINTGDACNSGAVEAAHVSVNLDSGWNMISANVEPVNPDMDAIFYQPLRDKLVLCKDGQGEVYWPEFSINDIGDWDELSGYQCYMSESDTLFVFGTKVVPEATPIDLPSGWSMIAYLRDTSTPAESALASILGDMVLTKDGLGQVFWPAYNVNQIGNMVPGEGYQTFMENPDNLVYPAND